MYLMARPGVITHRTKQAPKKTFSLSPIGLRAVERYQVFTLARFVIHNLFKAHKREFRLHRLHRLAVSKRKKVEFVMGNKKSIR